MKITPLPQDGDTPFSAPLPSRQDPSQTIERDAIQQKLSDQHQSTDIDLDETEFYNEGLAGAAEAAEPNADSAVVSYDPSLNRNPTDRSLRPDPAKNDNGSNYE